MRLGVFSGVQWTGDPGRSRFSENVLDQLVAAEEQGYDCAWLALHAPGIDPSIRLSAAQLAARTTRIRIGTVIALPSVLHPLRLAEEITMLDILSGGRVEWGVTHRGREPEPGDASEQDEPQGHELLAEQLEIVRRAWTGERFAWEGRSFRFPEVACLPTPVQDPHPPIRVVARDASTVRWAAESRLSLMIDVFASVERAAKSRALYRETAVRAGVETSPDDQPLVRPVYVGKTTAAARAEATPALLSAFRAMQGAGLQAGGKDERGGRAGAGPGDSVEDGGEPGHTAEERERRLLEQCAIIGDAAYCRDRIDELRERVGLESLLIWQSFGDLPHEASMASQVRFVEEVAPHLA